jgi:hypothetical protein
MILETKQNSWPRRRCDIAAVPNSEDLIHHVMTEPIIQVQARPGPSDNLEEFQNRVRMRAAKVQKEMREKQQEEQKQVSWHRQTLLPIIMCWKKTAIAE